MGQALVDLQNAMAAVVVERDAAVHAMDDLAAQLAAAKATIVTLQGQVVADADLQALTAKAVDVKSTLDAAVQKDDPPVVA